MVETRSLKRSRRPSLGTDPCQEILTRLPVQSLLRFRCVSKTWRALIDDRRFARAHVALAIEKRPEPRMYLLEREGEVTECVVRCSETFEPIASHGRLHTDTFKKQLHGRRRTSRANDIGWRDVGAIDGLFMLVANFNKDRLMLWNPSIKRARVLPPPPKTRRDGANIVDIGLGFDPSIEDYKHVRFILTGDHRRRALHWVLVYTLGTNSWKANTFEDKGCPSWRWSSSSSQPKTVCFRGLMYILAFREPVHPNKLPRPFDLVLYDLSNEEFTSSNLPTDENLKLSYYHCDLRLAKGGSSLALVYLPPMWEGSIWLAHGVGADLTWSKHFTLAPPNHHVSSYFLYLDKNGEEMISLLGTHMVTSYNLKTHEEKVVEKENARLLNLRVCPYVESLMLLN